MLVKYQTSIQLKAVNILTRCHLSTDTTYINIYIYIWYRPLCTHACLLNLGFRTTWVIWIGGFAARSYLSSVSFSTKLSPRNQIERIHNAFN